MPYQLLESQFIYKGRIFGLSKDQVEFQSGAVVQIDVVHHNGGAAVVAVNERLEVAIVKQYRHPMREFCLELPAGKLEEGDSPEEAARRELEEEAGLVAADWKLLSVAYPAPGYCSERLYIYLARELKAVESRPDFDEELEVIYLPFDRACEMIYSGEIKDAKTIIGLLATDRLLRQERK